MACAKVLHSVDTMLSFSRERGLEVWASEGASLQQSTGGDACDSTVLRISPAWQRSSDASRSVRYSCTAITVQRSQSQTARVPFYRIQI